MVVVKLAIAVKTKANKRTLISLFEIKVVVYICLFACLQPDYLKNIPLIDLTYQAIEALVLLMCLFRFFIHRGIPTFAPYVFLFYLPMYLATILSGESLQYALQKSVLAITFCMLIDIAAYFQGRELLRILRNVLVVLISANLLLLIAAPYGLASATEASVNYRLYFLGIKNGLAPWLALGFLSAYAYFKFKMDAKSKNLCIYLAAVSVFLAIWEQTSTGFVAVASMLVCAGLLELRGPVTKLRRPSVFEGVIVSVTAVAAFFGVVVFRVQELFSGLLGILFGKDATLTGRTNLWDQAMYLIAQNPIVGYGIREDSLIMSSYGRGFTSHNFILQALLSGGVLSLAFFVLMIGSVVKKMWSYRSTLAVRALGIGFVVFMVCALTESGITDYRWMGLFALMYASPIFLERIDRSEV